MNKKATKTAVILFLFMTAALCSVISKTAQSFHAELIRSTPHIFIYFILYPNTSFPW